MNDFPKTVPLRNIRVMLADRAAEVFEMMTRTVVQAIKTNPDKFDDFSNRYAFQVTQNEVDGLRSAGLIPKPGRGGSRALPWALTRKGVLRLATFVKSPKGVVIVDQLLDIFDELVEQIA